MRDKTEVFLLVSQLVFMIGVAVAVATLESENKGLKKYIMDAHQSCIIHADGFSYCRRVN